MARIDGYLALDFNILQHFPGRNHRLRKVDQLRALQAHAPKTCRVQFCVPCSDTSRPALNRATPREGREVLVLRTCVSDFA